MKHETPHASGAPEQVAAPLAAGAAHGVHIVPQLAGNVSSTHWPLQSWKPRLQRYPHLPAVHVGWAFAPTWHVIPQALQLFGSLVRSTHCWLQRVGVGAVHDGTHW